MNIEYQKLNTIDEVNLAINQMLNYRNELKNSLINRKIESAFTQKEGYIADVDNKRLCLRFECMDVASININNYQNIINVDESIKENIANYLESFEVNKKLNRILRKIERKNS